MRDVIIGARLGDEPEQYFHHFYRCRACDQPVDKLDLAAVFHHETAGHHPLLAADAVRMVKADLMLERALHGTLRLTTA